TMAPAVVSAMPNSVSSAASSGSSHFATLWLWYGPILTAWRAAGPEVGPDAAQHTPVLRPDSVDSQARRAAPTSRPAPPRRPSGHRPRVRHCAGDAGGLRDHHRPDGCAILTG